MKIDERLARNAITPQEESHITIDQQKCKRCKERPCIYACPGYLYELIEETSKMRVEHSGCLECGTCLVVCAEGALDWSYPDGGMGIRYRMG